MAVPDDFEVVVHWRSSASPVTAGISPVVAQGLAQVVASIYPNEVTGISELRLDNRASLVHAIELFYRHSLKHGSIAVVAADSSVWTFRPGVVDAIQIRDPQSNSADIPDAFRRAFFDAGSEGGAG